MAHYFSLNAAVALKGDSTVTGRALGQDHRDGTEYTRVRWDADGVITEIPTVYLTLATRDAS